ncbi:MAG: 1-deoxy-D-xylulose-5-phosphate reductoisomerase [Alphaproteobacteria bacterium]|nr:1-deoxy-D-xylulose-5-phosphate reductoisomerase [Alphaproteobacteria bacterium]
MPPSPEPRRVSILGATGSIGTSTLDLIARGDGHYRVEAVTAGTNVKELAAIARATGAAYAAIADESLLGELRQELADTTTRVGAGPGALEEAARMDADWVMAAIVGAAGLAPTLAAVRQGGVVALANKEALVCAGGLMIEEARQSGCVLLPADSEHNAIFQVFDADRIDAIEKIWLTASGGPFRDATRARMMAATPEEAVRHPNWSMGRKISIDSATMMNKSLEIIEASHLFPVSEERIGVIVHPESIVHGLVSYHDGSVLAGLAAPDMRTPIAHTLAWPDRIPASSRRLDLAATGQLTFELPDENRFPALGLARAAIHAGGSAPVTLNAANEVAVAAFLDRRSGFLDIVAVVEATLARVGTAATGDIGAVIMADDEARRRAEEMVLERSERTP